MALKEFFGIGGYQRTPEGYLSWQHLTFVTSLMVIMISMAIWLGLKNRNADEKKKNRVLIVSAIAIDLLELFKIILGCVENKDPLHFVYDLPLFLCSIQLIALPIAAFAKGKLREPALDFVTIFAPLGAVLGTYAAGQNYACYPVLSFDNVNSGITHCISGFAAFYIMISGLASLKRKNAPYTLIILSSFAVAAYVANIFTDSNYMFLSRGDGTPYDLVFNFVNGNPVLYPLCVIGLFVVYIGIYYYIYYAAERAKQGHVQKNDADQKKTA